MKIENIKNKKLNHIKTLLLGALGLFLLSGCPVDTTDPEKTASSIPAESISIINSSGIISITNRQTGNLTVVVLPTNHTEGAVMWASSDTSKLTITSNDPYSATYSAIAPSFPNNVTVTATVGSVSSAASFKIRQPATNVTIIQGNITNDNGVTSNLTATILPSNHTDSITWRSSDASKLTISSNGRYTTIDSGTVTVFVIAGTITNSVNITINRNATNIIIAGRNFGILTNSTGTLTATVTPTNHDSGNVIWTSSHTNILTINSNSGNYIAGSNSGMTTITAMVGKLSNTITISVSDTLATNFVFSSHITTNETRFYEETNILFYTRIESTVSYVTNSSMTTNIFLSNNDDPSNLTSSIYLSNLISVSTNEMIETNTVGSTSNSYLSSNYITNYELIAIGVTNSYITNTNENVIAGINTDWSGLDFSGADLANLILGGYNLSGGIFSNANFSNAYLVGANLTGGDFANANVTNASCDLTSYNYLYGLGLRGHINESSQKVLNDFIAANVNFGRYVSISGDYAIIGAPNGTFVTNISSGDYYRGHASVFHRSNGMWQHRTNLMASDVETTNTFAVSVFLSGNTAIIGSINNDADNYKGAAYIYERQNNGTWTETKLTASDGANNDYFGDSVSMSGDYAIVGASGDDSARGSAYIFERQNNGNWIQTNKLTASDAANSDAFGLSVSISGDYAIIGSRDNNKGSAYIFQRQNNGTWTETKLTASDGGGNDQFGDSVSISGDYAIMGAPQDTDAGINTGSAYIFQRQGNSWIQTNKLLASDRATQDRFGDSVSISGDYAIVGAFGDDSARGSAYLFQRQNNGNWIQTDKLTASDGANNDRFGISVAIDSNYVLVGAQLNDENGTNDVGAAYFIQYK